jgi:ATP-dependent exoDNAse (exonuclease V) beta subunit
VTEFTKEQRAAIDSREGPLIVAATAGSGKTSVMVERFVEAVRQDGVAVEAILAITFTEKAAAQLRTRIRGRFDELGETAGARAAENANVSTIDAFCARVLRANAVAAGLDPEFAILDEVRAAQLARAAFDAALDELQRQHGERVTDLVAAYTAEILRTTVSGLHDRLRSRGEAHPVLPPARLRTPDVATALAAVDAALPAAAACAAGAADGVTVRAAQDALARCAELLARTGAGQVPTVAEAEALKLPGQQVTALATSECDAYRDAVAGLFSACVDHAALPVHALLADLLRLYGERYAESKRAASQLDFADLELGVRDLFRARPALADGVGARFAMVMVDEFQDTNRVQLEILDALGRDKRFSVGDPLQSIYRFRHAAVELFEDERERLAAQGAALELSDNFRSAEPLLDAVNAVAPGALGNGFIPLTAGRSVVPDGPPALVELLVTDTQGWKGDEEQDPVDFGTTLPGKILWRVAEARLVAQRLRELVDTTRYEPGDIVLLLRATGDMPLFERALEEAGLPTYLIGGRGYFAHPQVRDVVAWLSLIANPDDDESLWCVLASPLVGLRTDGLLLAAMAAQAAGRTPWWLLRAAVAGDDPERLLDALSPEDRERVARFVATLSDERAGAARRPLEALIERALERTGYDLRMLAMPGGARRLANVRKLMRLAAEHEAGEGRSLRGFLDLVAELADERRYGGREGEAPLHGEEDEAVALPAVRIMTIHRAKGLEFPVVCLADLGRGPVSASSEVVLVGSRPDDQRVGIRLRSLERAGIPAMDYEELLEEEKCADAAEERRLAYVAMTRAQERLVLSGATSVASWRSPDGLVAPLAWIGPAFVPGIAERLSAEHPVLEDDGELQWDGRPVRVSARLNARDTLGRVLAAPVPPPPQTPAAPPAADAIREPEPPPLPPAGPPVEHVSYSALEAYARCGYRFYLERVLRLPGEEPPAPAGAPGDGAGVRSEATSEAEPDEPGLTPLVRGSVAHALLEDIDFRAPAAPAAADVLSAAAAQGAELSAGEAAELAELIDRFLASDLCARLAAARSLRQEAPFAYPFALPGGGRLIVNGVVDAMGTEDRRTLVVDYKSDRLDGRDPVELVDRAYATQRLVYALAALREGAEAVDVVYCFLERPDEPVITGYGAADAAALEAELSAVVAGIAAWRFDVSESPNRELCAGCPGRGTLCSWPLEATYAEPA